MACRAGTVKIVAAARAGASAGPCYVENRGVNLRAYDQILNPCAPARQRAKAEVNTEAESEMALGFSVDVEPKRVIEDVVTSIARPLRYSSPDGRRPSPPRYR
jgi:hypothetical protein